MKSPLTAREIGDQSADKILHPFGSASIRKPVSEGIAKAESADARLRADLAA